MRTVPPCWSLYDAYSARAGATWRRLLVLPPGSTPAEARAFRWAAECSWAGVAAAQLVFALGSLGAARRGTRCAQRVWNA